jgi:AraC family transcriptional activator of mtrCDE
MDVLADWLREIETYAVVLCQCRVPAPWGMAIGARDGIMFHIVAEGACWLRRNGCEPLALSQGDLVLLPHGLDHELLDNPDGESEPLDQFLARTSFPLTGPITTVVCGVYLSDAQLAHPMLRALPPVVHFPASSVQTKPALAATLSLLIAELDHCAPGGEALIQHLFDTLFIYIVRAWADETAAERLGWLSALKDPSLSKALGRMHAEPGGQWTVKSLAREAGLSRAAFARSFSEQVGEPPLAYLTRWRMGIAARLLRSSEMSVAQIAAHVGYESEFAFSRAFKRNRGLAPARFRHAQCPRTAE